jgi:hypothetical protein
MPNVRFSPKAKLTWTDQEGKELEVEDCYRSLYALHEHIWGRVRADNEILQRRLSIEVVPMGIDGGEPPALATPEGKPIKFTIAAGGVEDVLKDIAKRMLSPRHVILQLQAMVQQMADMSGLKGVILTVVCDNAAAAGFGMFTESTEVTEEDRKTLGAAAANQVEMYKDAMWGKHQVVCPDDLKKPTERQGNRWQDPGFLRASGGGIIVPG